MLRLHVLLEFSTDTELRQAVTANMWPERPPDRVTVHMLPQMLSAGEGLGTRGAGVWLVAVVEFYVTTEVPDSCKEHATDATFELHDAVDVTDVIGLRVLNIIRLDCIQITNTLLLLFTLMPSVVKVPEGQKLNQS